MKTRIQQIVNDIHLSLQHYFPDSIGLIGDGIAARSMYDFHYQRYTGKLNNDEHFHAQLEQLAEKAMLSPVTNLCIGKSGVHWYFSYLYKTGLLDTDDWEFLCSDDEALAAEALRMLEADNADLLHGATGIAYQLLYARGRKFARFFERYFELLLLLMAKSRSGQVVPLWQFDQHTINPGKVNFGLAHGIPSIIKLCLQCYEQDICRETAQRIARQHIDYLLAHVNKDTSLNYFPCTVEEGVQQDQYSRMAWCYGDMTVAYVLYQAGKLFADQQLTGFSLKVLQHAAQRHHGDGTGVADAGICHGSAGLAHVFNKLWHQTNITDFKTAGEHWIARTLELAQYDEGYIVFRRYDSLNKEYVNCYSLLEGTAGVGLVLISYLTEDYNWDYCLQLN